MKSTLLAYVLFLLSYLNFVRPSDVTEDQIISKAIKKWKYQIVDEEYIIKDTASFTDNIIILRERLDLIKENVDFTAKIYPLALKSVEIFSRVYELNPTGIDKEKVDRLAICVYDFMTAFKEHLSEFSCMKYFLTCLNVILTYGNGATFENFYFEPKDDENIVRIIYFISKYLKKFDNPSNNILLFYFYYVDLAGVRNLFQELVDSSHPIDCLLYIYKFKSLFRHSFVLWIRVYFRMIPFIFEKHLQEPSKVKILLELAKVVDLQEDVECVVEIFAANNITHFIYEHPPLLAAAMDILINLKDAFPETFNEHFQNLGELRANILTNEMQKRRLTKIQMMTAISARKLLQRMVLNAEMTLTDCLKDWLAALEEMLKLDLLKLKSEDSQSIGQIMKDSYMKLFNNYEEIPSDSLLFILNAYIPVLTKLNILNEDGLEIAKIITSDYADYLAYKFSSKEDEISLIELTETVNKFHGEVFTNDHHILIRETNKFTKYWKLNVFAMKVFVEFLSGINWFEDSLAVANIAQRVLSFARKEQRTLQESIDILEIIDFLEYEMKCLNKTQAMLLRSLI